MREMSIVDFINERLDSGEYDRNFELGTELNISSAQLTHYKMGRTRQSSLELAQRIYTKYQVVIYPYSEGAVDVSER